MKILNAKFYQAISVWNGTKPQLMTYIDTASPNINGEVEVTLIPGLGLKIKAHGRATIVTLNNIAFLSLDESEETEAPKVKAVKKA